MQSSREKTHKTKIPPKNKKDILPPIWDLRASTWEVRVETSFSLFSNFSIVSEGKKRKKKKKKYKISVSSSKGTRCLCNSLLMLSVCQYSPKILWPHDSWWLNLLFGAKEAAIRSLTLTNADNCSGNSSTLPWKRDHLASWRWGASNRDRTGPGWNLQLRCHAV